MTYSIRHTYINVLGWMIEDFNLSGNELLLYAIIYGYSQDGENVYRGSLTYIQKALGISKPTVISLLKKLQEKGFIEKKGGGKESLPSEWKVVKKFNQGGKETLLVGGKETLPNTNNNTNNNTNDIMSTDIKEEALEVYNYYIRKVKTYGPYNIKYNKKALAIERISKLLKQKKLTKEDLFGYIEYYVKIQREQIKEGYAKMAQYFFGPVERGSKVGYWEDYIPPTETKEQKKTIGVEDLGF